MMWKNYSYRETAVIGLWGRAARIVLGAALIGIVMAYREAPLGWIALLPLLAVYPVLTGAVGRDPLRSGIHGIRMRRNWIAAQRSLADNLPPAVLDTRTPQPQKAA